MSLAVLFKLFPFILSEKIDDFIVKGNSNYCKIPTKKREPKLSFYLLLLLWTDMRVISRKLKYARKSIAIAIKNSVGS